jgi:hypothetical protein
MDIDPDVPEWIPRAYATLKSICKDDVWTELLDKWQVHEAKMGYPGVCNRIFLTCKLFLITLICNLGYVYQRFLPHYRS